MKKRSVGKTGLEIDILGVGGAPLGGNFADLDRARAATLLKTARDAGLTYVDTAPFYGFGRSERVVGDVLRGRSYVVSTKVGRLLAPGPAEDPMNFGMIDPLPFHPVYDYTYDGIMRSFEDSQQRLGLDRIDILLVHDIGEFQHGKEENDRHFADLAATGYRAMEELRSAGKVDAIGLGVNENEICMRSLDIGQWDVFLLAGRYTLLEQTPLDGLFPACAEQGTSIICGGPFNSGVLVGREMWNYALAPDDVVERVNELLPQTQCAQCGYPGCRPYARAIVDEGAGINLCPPGGDETIRRLAELLGRDVLALADPAPAGRAVAIIDEIEEGMAFGDELALVVGADGQVEYSP